MMVVYTCISETVSVAKRSTQDKYVLASNKCAASVNCRWELRLSPTNLHGQTTADSGFVQINL